MLNGANLKKAYYYLKKNGLKQTRYAVCERLFRKDSVPYNYAPLTEEERIRQEKELWEEPIVFSIVVPMYETDEAYAKEMIQSVLNQTYPHFELILADASPTDKVSCVVRSFSDDRILYKKLDNNLGISENTNEALKWATGEYTALLDHDDLLTPDALYENAKEIKRQKETKSRPIFIYSDEDKLAEDGKTYYDPNIKPKFNKDLLLSNNYICHFLVMRTDIIKKLGFRKEFDGAQDFDLVLRASIEQKDEAKICHIPKVLYHWRCHRLSTAANPQSKLYAYEAGKRAIEDYLVSCHIDAKVDHTMHNGFYRVEYRNIFKQRSDVGVVAGPIYNKNKITSGICDEEGNPLFEGLNKNHSGYLHRATLHQDAEVVDFRNVQVRPELEHIIRNAMEKEKSNLGLIINEGNWKRINVALSNVVKTAGYLLYYDPKAEPLQEDKL